MDRTTKAAIMATIIQRAPADAAKVPSMVLWTTTLVLVFLFVGITLLVLS
jgi:hypothetical protein